MSKEPKIVHACNHMIVSKTKQYGRINMVRGDSPNMHDAMPRNIKVTRVDRIESAEGRVFKKGYHYNQSISQDIIEWTSKEGTPAYNESYAVYAAYIYTSSSKHHVGECPRCGGNGWYVSLTNSEGQMGFVEGAQKLIQDFIKIINTESDGTYGSTIKNVLGENIYSEININNSISSSIMSCQEFLLAKQNLELQNGVELPDDELLERIEVKQVYFAREESAYVISLVIYNKAGKAIRFNFKI